MIKFYFILIIWLFLLITLSYDIANSIYYKHNVNILKLSLLPEADRNTIIKKMLSKFDIKDDFMIILYLIWLFPAILVIYPVIFITTKVLKIHFPA